MMSFFPFSDRPLLVYLGTAPAWARAQAAFDALLFGS